ncbi:MAG: hypothetical protein ACUVT3_04485 [Ignavibacterium sp.]
MLGKISKKFVEARVINLPEFTSEVSDGEKIEVFLWTDRQIPAYQYTVRNVGTGMTFFAYAWEFTISGKVIFPNMLSEYYVSDHLKIFILFLKPH